MADKKDQWVDELKQRIIAEMEEKHAKMTSEDFSRVQKAYQNIAVKETEADARLRRKEQVAVSLMLYALTLDMPAGMSALTYVSLLLEIQKHTIALEDLLHTLIDPTGKDTEDDLPALVDV